MHLDGKTEGSNFEMQTHRTLGNLLGAKGGLRMFLSSVRRVGYAFSV